MNSAIAEGAWSCSRQSAVFGISRCHEFRGMPRAIRKNQCGYWLNKTTVHLASRERLLRYFTIILYYDTWLTCDLAVQVKPAAGVTLGAHCLSERVERNHPGIRLASPALEPLGVQERKTQSSTLECPHMQTGSLVRWRMETIDEEQARKPC